MNEITKTNFKIAVTISNIKVKLKFYLWESFLLDFLYSQR